MTEAIVRKKAQRSKRNQHRAVSRARDKGKGSGDYFQYHLHNGNLLLIFLPTFYHAWPGDINVAND